MEKHKLIMLPGWSMDSSVWEPIVPFLSEYFHLVFCEWHGIEDIEGYMTRVYGLVEKEEGKLFMMGWSLGSLLAIDAACKYKGKIERLILVSGTSRFTRDKKTHYSCGWPESVVEKMKAALNNDREKTMNSFYTSMFSVEEMGNGRYEDFMKTISMGQTKSNRELEAGLDLLLQTDIRHLLLDIEVPLLLIHGEKDTICPAQASEYISSQVKGKAVLNIMTGTGHVPFHTATNEFSELIKIFMEQGEKE